MTTRYMHTLDGKPATYNPNSGGYIHFVGGRNKARLENSLEVIRQQQKNDAKTALHNAQYGYVLVEDAS